MTWPTKKLGEVFEFKYGKGIPRIDRSPEGKYPVYGANGILDYSDKYLVNGEAVIVGRKGSAGEVARVSGKFWPSDVTYYILGNKQIDINYAFYLLKSLNLQKFAVGVKPGINRNRVYEVEILLPPLADQKKIVAKLEKLLGKIKEAKKLRAEAQEATQNLLPAALQKIFSEGKKKGWEEEKISDLREEIKMVNPAKDFKDTFSYIDITSIGAGLNAIPQARVLLKNEAPSRARKLVREGDTIFATTRPYLKKIAFIAGALDGAVASTGFCVIRPKRDLIDPRYLFLVASSDPFISEVVVFQKGATYPAVSDSVIYKRKILLPPLSEQKKIVAYLDSLSAKVQSLQKAQDETARDLVALEQSILHQAFSGKLV